MSYIKIEHLKYHYPDTTVLSLNDINLEIEKGRFIGVIGENGAGKSTFCLALSGLVPTFYKGAYGGKIIIENMEVAKTPISKLCQKVGLVFQNPFTQLSGAKDTVFDEVAFGLQNLGIPREEIINRVNEVLKLLDIFEYKDRNPFDLSGGQMQRVALASIIAMKPDVLILDEPTSQLDPAGTEEIFHAVDKLKKSGITIIMVEQKIEKMAEYCDKIMLMHQGSLIDFDVPEKIFSRDDLLSFGIDAPVYTKLCKFYNIKKSNGYYPASLKETLALKTAFADKFMLLQEKNTDTCIENEKSTIFQIEDLSFHYEKQQNIFNQLSLTIQQESTAIVGQNGAGKTTLVKLLKGLLKPVCGYIYYQGNDIHEKTVAMLAGDVGYVFQNPDDQIFKYTVLDEVMFGPLNIGMSKESAKEKALEALEIVGLKEKEKINPYDLDLSERKLVAIASVLAMDTQVLILDEPTIGQDKKGKEIIGNIILNLKKSGKTVISILHDMDFVAAYFDRVVVMKKGRIIASGTRETVFAQNDILEEAFIEQPYLSKLCNLLGLSNLYFSMEDLPK